MFLSYNYIGGDVYRIIDSDFVENFGPFFWALESIIFCYSSKDLNVAYNIFLYHLFCQSKKIYDIQYSKIDDQIYQCLTSIPSYHLYIDDVKKYIERYKK